MSDVIAAGRESAPHMPPSPRAAQESQGQLLGKVEPTAKPGAATAGAAIELPPVEAASRPWETPLKEARSSVQSLESHIKSTLSGTMTGSEPSLAAVGNRVNAALESVWKDPQLSSTLTAQGQTQESIKSDLGAGRFDQVVSTLQKTETSLNEAHRQSLGLPVAIFDKPANDIGRAVPANAASTAAAAKPEPSVAAPASGTAQQVPIVELVQRLQGASVNLSERDAGLARGINKLAETASADPSATSQAVFRTHVAYSLQDTEKALGAGIVPMTAELRVEMSRLAGTSPGLENKQMESILRSTPELDDRGLVRDLRRAAESIATLGSNQNSTAVQQHVEVLENKVRLSPKTTANKAASPLSDRPVYARTDGGVEPGPSREALAVTSAPSDRSSDRPVEVRAETANQPEGVGTIRAAASPGGGWQRPEKDSENQPAPVQKAKVVVAESKPKTAMAQVMDNLRSPASSAPPPWTPTTFAMGERITKFERLMDQGKTEQLISASERSGVAMMKSIETFSRGPGAAILGKIDAAASTEQGGIKAVMREMQPGGRYAELRSQFDSALQSDRAFAASYNQVGKTAAQHGKDRLALEADFQAKGLDVRQLGARFGKADEAICEATERIPGRTPGKSVMEELGQKVAEIFNKAIERVRAMFGRESAPEARASASPGMSP